METDSIYFSLFNLKKPRDSLHDEYLTIVLFFNLCFFFFFNYSYWQILCRSDAGNCIVVRAVWKLNCSLTHITLMESNVYISFLLIFL